MKNQSQFLLIMAVLVVSLLASPVAYTQDPAAVSAKHSRVTAGLQVLYDFRTPSGQLIRDHSGT